MAAAFAAFSCVSLRAQDAGPTLPSTPQPRAQADENGQTGGSYVGDAAMPRAGFERLLESVVRLDVWETTFQGGAERTQRGVGSGVIVSEDGQILTNAHVANPYAERVRVTLNSLETVDAAFVGWDHWTDLAVVQIDMEDARERGLQFAYAGFGDSSGLEPGDPVYAVGTPNGLTRTVTRGIISNTDRYFQGRTVAGGYETGEFNTWLQTDAAINPGNSGGPLVLPDGRVIGINTRGYLGSNNLGFAVPGEVAREVMATLIAEGEVTRSYVGLVPGPLQDLENFFQLETNQGMLVQNVDPGSPADEAGLTAGDIVLAIDGNAVDGRFPEQLPPILNRIASRPVGSELTLTIKDGEGTETITLTTERLESRVGEKEAFEDWGLTVQKISRAVAREEKLESADGVRIIGVQSGYPAAEANLSRGEDIVAVNRESLTSLEQLKEVYEAYQQDPQKVLLEVRRNHQVFLRVLRPRGD